MEDTGEALRSLKEMAACTAERMEFGSDVEEDCLERTWVPLEQRDRVKSGKLVPDAGGSD